MKKTKLLKNDEYRKRYHSAILEIKPQAGFGVNRLIARAIETDRIIKERPNSFQRW